MSRSPHPPLLRVHALGFSRNDAVVFGPLDFAVDPGEALLVQGDNGAGKTTLLRVLAGLLRAESGRIEIDGHEPDPVSRARAVAYLGHLPALKAAAGDTLVEVSTSEVPDDWADRWKAWHRPVDVAWRFRRLRVRPPWEEALADEDGIDLELLREVKEERRERIDAYADARPGAYLAVVVPGFGAALAAAAEADGCDTVWVIGGATLYEQALDVASRAEVTVIDADVDGDTHAPRLDARWRRTAVDPAPDAWLDSASGPRHRFERWERD